MFSKSFVIALGLSFASFACAATQSVIVTIQNASNYKMSYIYQLQGTQITFTNGDPASIKPGGSLMFQLTSPGVTQGPTANFTFNLQASDSGVQPTCAIKVSGSTITETYSSGAKCSTNQNSANQSTVVVTEAH